MSSTGTGKPTGSFRIAYFTSWFPTLSETFIYNEMIALREQGFSPSLVVFGPSNEKTVHGYVEPLRELVVYASPLLSWAHLLSHLYFLIRRPGRYLSVLGQIIYATARHPMILGKSLYAFGKGVALARTLRGRSPQHLHAHWATMPTTAALVVSRLLDTPFSFTAHAWDIYREPAMLPEKMRAAQFVVTISHYNRNYLQSLCPHLPPERVQVVHCGIDLERFSFSPPVSTSLPLIFSVGRLVEKKGLHWLVEACALLRDQNVPFRCEIVGQGPLRSSLEALIAHHDLGEIVHLRGGLPQEEVRSLFGSASIFVLPCVVESNGNRDGIPVALMEAMASGVPVISTAISGIPELVKNEVTGLLVPPKDAKALALAIERLLSDQTLQRKVARQARQRVEQEYNIKLNAQRKGEWFRGVITESIPKCMMDGMGRQRVLD